ncbi:MAG: VWA domain-containing protein [Phycisphaerae bacterium]|nr:VWA domain-containing protein [Phycisphaerae bacterium]
MKEYTHVRTGDSVSEVNLWAWSISIGLHICVIGTFAAVKFSGRAAVQEHQIPNASIAEQEIHFNEPILPKPKLKTLFAKTSFTEADNITSPVFERPNLVTLPVVEEKPQAEIFDDAEYAALIPKTEFFGSKTSDRKICYVVDCSGSMKPVFRHVRDKLRESVNVLAADQFFAVIFFGNEQIYQFPSGGLVRASVKNKHAAIEFIDSMRAAGTTNAVDALERSLAIGWVQTIFFLTDGFELEGEGVFDGRIETLAVKAGGGVKINTIGFWPQQHDIELLELIASQTGGEFIFVTD